MASQTSNPNPAGEPGQLGTLPRHVVRKGKIPVLSSEETRTLLDSIKVSEI